jgi:hypothetical protein
MRLGVLLVLIAACGSDNDGDFPILPNTSTSTSGGPRVDGGVVLDALLGDGGTVVTVITGRVCVVVDLRVPTVCAATGAGGLVVTLDGAIATTAADGSFTIPTVQSSFLTWTVTGAGIVPSVVPLTTSALVPAMNASAYIDLLDANGVLIAVGQGSVVARVVTALGPVSGVTAVPVPVGTAPVLYDTATSALTWSQDRTDGFGVVWLPAMAATSEQAITFTPPAPLVTRIVPHIPVLSGAITFITVDL